MKTTKVLTLIAMAATVAACGSFEWFPPVADTTPPTVSASISGNSIFNNRTTHVSALPATVTFFSANEPATIYYTTNGTAPTTSSSSVVIPSTTGVAGPSISVTNTILKFFGIDKSSNSSAIQTGTIASP